MLTVRDAVKLLSVYLDVEVVPYAARLMRHGVLPRRGEAIDEREAATLLLAIAVTADPDRAVDALAVLGGAPLRHVERPILGTAPDVQTWQRTTRHDSHRLPLEALEVVTEALQGNLAINWLAIDDGGGAAMFETAVDEGCPLFCRVVYAVQRGAPVMGMKRVTQINGAVVIALANALRPEEHRARVVYPASLELQ